METTTAGRDTRRSDDNNLNVTGRHQPTPRVVIEGESKGDDAAYAALVWNVDVGPRSAVDGGAKHLLKRGYTL